MALPLSLKKAVSPHARQPVKLAIGRNTRCLSAPSGVSAAIHVRDRRAKARVVRVNVGYQHGMNGLATL